MYTIIARQPIFDSEMNIVAYSLYYRDSLDNFSKSKGDDATASVIVNGPLMMGYEKLTEEKPAIIKFTKDLLNKEVVLLLQPKDMWVEIVDFIDSEKLVDTIKNLKVYGYKVAINNEYIRNSDKSLIQYIDIITIDFSKNGLETIEELLELSSNGKIRLMAYKVETREQYEFARAIGFKWYQGNFFMKPVLVKTKSIRPIKSAYVNLMTELSSIEPDMAKISNIIKNDLALSYRILRLVNASAYGSLTKITDIHHALVRIGQKDLFKWLGLVVMDDYSKDKPNIYSNTSMIRGKAMENIALMMESKSYATDLFLTGMFSMIDVILERDMSLVMDELPLNDQIKTALLGQDNYLKGLLDIVIAYENLEWESINCMIGDYKGLSKEIIIESYTGAIEWSLET